MNKNPDPLHRGLKVALATLQLTGLFFLASCGSETRISTGGETHFLKSCSPEDNSCGGALECVCGVCTRLCDDEAACSELPGAACTTVTTEARCGAKPTAHCDSECRRDSDCAGVSPFHVCNDGVCRTESPPGPPAPEAPDASAPIPTSEPSFDAAPDPSTTVDPTCVRGEVNPNEVLLIGDSFFATTHQVTAYLEEFARSSGALLEGERYRDESRVVANALAGGGIEEQYRSAFEDSPVRVVIMNGGGADAFVSTCDPAEDCSELLDAVTAAETLLARMDEDGVTHVVYAFYPHSNDESLRNRVDYLRPYLQTVCEQAPVPCHWLDLRDTFVDHMDEYIAMDGSMPTAAGAEASARAIWDVMQSACIAQ